MSKLNRLLKIMIVYTGLMVSIVGCENKDETSDTYIRDADKSIINTSIKGSKTINKVEKKIESIIDNATKEEVKTEDIKRNIESTGYTPKFICDNDFIEYKDTKVLDNLSLKMPAYNAVEYTNAYRLYRQDKIDILFVYGEEDSNNNVLLENIQNKTQKQFKNILEKEIVKGYKLKKINITDSVKIQINNIETTRFIGSVILEKSKNKKTKTYSLCGYSFVYKNKPVTIYGIANNIKSDIDYTNEVKSNLDEMMRTIQIIN